MSEDGKLWHSHKGQIRKANPINVAVKNNFYRIIDLTPIDIAFLMTWCSSMRHPDLQAICKSHVEQAKIMMDVKQAIADGHPVPVHLQEIVDDFFQSSEEEYHATIESEGGPFIADILEEKLDFFYTPSGFIKFAQYIAHQWMRTKNLQDRVISASTDMKGVNIRAVVQWTRRFASIGLTANLIGTREKWRLILLKTSPDNAFIAGDQPLINTKAIGKAIGVEEADFEIYFPVSPTVAILMTENPRFAHRESVELSPRAAHLLNLALAHRAEEFIFGSTEESVRLYGSHLGKRFDDDSLQELQEILRDNNQQ